MGVSGSRSPGPSKKPGSTPGDGRPRDRPRCRDGQCPTSFRALSAFQDFGRRAAISSPGASSAASPLEVAGRGPPALDGVKSPARLATSSGGLAIVHVRPSGEPARTSRSAHGAPLTGTGPRSLPVVVVGYANNAAASFATNEASCVPPCDPDRAPGLGADARWPPARARIGVLRRTNLWPRESVPMGQWLRPARWLTNHGLKRSVRVNEGAAGCGR